MEKGSLECTFLPQYLLKLVKCKSNILDENFIYEETKSERTVSEYMNLHSCTLLSTSCQLELASYSRVFVFYFLSASFNRLPGV